MKRFDFLAILAAFTILILPAAFAQPAQAAVVKTALNSSFCVDYNQSSHQFALWTCNGGANENFFTSAYGPQKFNGLCLDGNGSGQSLTLAACNNGSKSQIWAISSAGELKNEAGWCADVPNQSAYQGQRIQMFTCNHGTNQRWTMGAYTAPAPVKVAPAAGPAVKTSPNGTPLVGNAGGTLVGPSGGTLIGNAGGTLIGQDGAGKPGSR